jgi:cytochrome d ubiquinol oxidase subunit II
MLYVVLLFVVLSFFLYVLLGGADFGAGTLELFSGPEHKKSIKKTVYSVMGPVWRLTTFGSSFLLWCCG